MAARTTQTVNTTQGAAMLGVQRRTFRNICTRENITPVSHKANEVLYRKSDIARLVKKAERAAKNSEKTKTAGKMKSIGKISLGTLPPPGNT